VEWCRVGGHPSDGIRPAQDEPGAGRAGQALPATEQDEVRALLAEPPEVVAWRELCGGVDDHRHAVMAGRFHHDGEWKDVAGEVGLRDVDDGRSLRREQRAQLATSLPAGTARRRCAGLRTELDEPAAGELDDGVVRHAVRAVDDELARISVQVGGSEDAVAGPAGHARRRREEQASRCATGDEGRLVPGQLREPPADGLLELDQVDERGSRLSHGFEHLGRHERATEDRER
jgi:hypothetical protein